MNFGYRSHANMQRILYARLTGAGPPTNRRSAINTAERPTGCDMLEKPEALLGRPEIAVDEAKPMRRPINIRGDHDRAP